MIPGFSTRLGWESGWKSYMANSKDWRSENVYVIELNCKVVKKVATSPAPPSLHHPPPFQVYLLFLAKTFVTPKWLNFWKILPFPFNKVGAPTMGTGVFLWIFAKSLRTPLLQNTSWRLLLMNICERLLLHFWKLFCKNIFHILT